MIPYLISIVVFIATNIPANVTAVWNESNISMSTTNINVLQSATDIYKNTVFQSSNIIEVGINPIVDNDKPSDSLDEILKKDADSEGLIANILGGLSLCYHFLANLLLYPIFSFLLLLLTLGIVILGTFWVKKIKSNQPMPTHWMIFTGLYLLFYFDLFLVVFQKRKILLLFLELEKDLLLMIVAAAIGYIVGKVFSSRSFEEKELP
ncbi:hypothetical protein [Cardinium endosymbiont of Culicoides punctatus]|uniref:hypothetical protein n=1 Tax=Cardinium endosymbiont of Culicoides punctatus TaxID=2304601 RepID=UPI0010583DF4|nr:hypothetical protein [Cardinium endosymbiont of Culicoides punctatus]TDG95616.1 hypothetical protein CCPUN_02350 [Cardinium endosymbiont of Culicoides punctatus]